MGILLHTLRDHEPLPDIFVQATRPARVYEAPPVDRSDFHSMVYVNLRDELMNALLDEPSRIVRTPGFPHNQRKSAEDILIDSTAGRGSEARVHQIAMILATAAKGGDLQALALFSDLAREHAEFHLEDAVTGDQS